MARAPFSKINQAMTSNSMLHQYIANRPDITPGSVKSQKRLPKTTDSQYPPDIFPIVTKKTLQVHCLQGFQMVTGAGFEPATFRL